MIKPSLAAMSMRKKTIVDNIKRGLTPAIASSSQSMQRGGTNIVINLIGTRESVYNILGHDGASGAEVMQKVLKTSADVVATQGRQLGEDASAGISMVADGGGLRFATIDSEKYGKVSLLQSQNTTSYSQGMAINGKALLSDRSVMQECVAIDRLLNGGFAASVDMSDLAQGEMRSALEAALELPFFRPRIALGICTTCGRKSRAVSERCEACKSPHKLQLYS
jgi:ribonucleoside-triphosphate reductase